MIRIPFHMLSQEHVIHYYLLSIRFPDWELNVQQNELEFGNSLESEQGTNRYEILKYWNKLLSTSEHEIRILFNVARAQGQWRIDVEKEVSAYLPDYDYKDAAANFSRWALLPFWTAEESVALTLGKDPRHVTSASVGPYVNVHPLATDFRDRLELLEREQEAGELPEKIAPADLIAWAPGRIEVPAALEAAVRAVTPKRGLVAEIKALKAELARLGDQQSVELNPNSRTSYRKLVLGMALRHYRYRPDSHRNSTAREMEEDLARFGISLSEETIRAMLVDSAEHIDFERHEKG